jgi:hypothetical protein
MRAAGNARVTSPPMREPTYFVKKLAVAAVRTAAMAWLLRRRPRPRPR